MWANTHGACPECGRLIPWGQIAMVYLVLPLLVPKERLCHVLFGVQQVTLVMGGWG